MEQLSPLAGVRVLDMSRIIAGPMAAQVLADCGADVVKIEAPGVGDPSRAYVAEGDELRRSPIFSNLNRNKRSVVLDLKSATERDALLEMTRGCDVLVHNFRQGVMDRLGLGYADLRAINSRLIYCAISGFGNRGPYRYRAANDVVAQAFGGVMSFTGEVGRQPVRSGSSIADVSAAMWATIGVMAALLERARTGVGREVTTSLFEGQINLAAPYLIEYCLTGTVARPMGSGTKVGLPNGTFPTQDRPVLIAAVDERVWRRLCAALSLSELADDPRFALLPDRRANRKQLEAAISERTSQLTSWECLDRLQNAGVPSGPINTVADVVNDPQFQALDMFADLTNADDVPERVVRLPFSLDGGEFPLRHSAPALGQDTQRALNNPADVWLHEDPAQADTLRPKPSRMQEERLMSESEELVIVRREVAGAVAVVELNNPPVNALSVELWTAIGAAFTKILDDQAIKAVVLTGSGRRAFCGGADVRQFLVLTSETRLERQRQVNTVLDTLTNYPLPVIAAINGPVVGGGITLCTVCDIRVSAATAHFSMPEIRRGTAGGGGAFLRRLSMPEGFLRLMLFTGRRFSAADLAQAHLVDMVVPAEDVLATSLLIASDIARNDRTSLMLMKRAVLDSELTIGDWMAAYKATHAATAEMTGLEAGRDGIREFLAEQQ